MLIERANYAQEKAKITHSEVDSLSWEISRKASQDLKSWGVPEESAAAALIAPLVRHEAVSEDSLGKEFGHETVELAKRALNWHAWMNTPLPNREANSLQAKYSLGLRQLFQQTYLDLPELKFTMLLLAEHNAHLTLVKSEPIAAASQAIFIPLAEMLGIWKLRSAWIEMSTAILEEAKYKELLAQTGEAGWYTPSSMQSVVAQKRYLTASRISTSLKEKAQTFLAFEKALIESFKSEGFRPLPRIQPRPVQPGVILWRVRDGKSLEELTDRVAVSIFCHTKSDCYRVLGIVHGLGKPVAPKYSQRFDDYIAAPQSNSYRALHTALMYRTAGFEKLVEVRILTPEMHRLNECGVIAAFFKNKSRYHTVNAWWNNVNKQTEALNKRYQFNPPLTVSDFINRYDLASDSDPIYVFTPRGEIVFLSEGYTTLDFAYHIHSDLGYHAGKITVNGRVVPYNYPLRNGDLVNVQYLSNSPGPDISWLSFVKSVHAKSRIRKQLRNQAQMKHPGRTVLQEALLRLIKQYNDQLGYDPRITTSQLDNFIRRWVKEHNLRDANELYGRVESKHNASHYLAHRLVSEQLISALVDQEGKSIKYYDYRFTICDNCRPTPPDPVIGIERSDRLSQKRVVVHRQASARCLSQDQHPRAFPLKWVEATVPSSKEVAIVQMVVEDRYKLLLDILGVFYAHPEAYLNKVEAQASSDETASVFIAVSVPDLQYLLKIQGELEQVRNVLSVAITPASPAQELLILHKHEHYSTNPYLEAEVYDRLNFFDREEQIKQIFGWLQGNDPKSWGILHGQPRVGKSSLAKHLTYVRLTENPLANPIYVTLQSLSHFGSLNLASLIAEGVFRSLGTHIPIQNPWEEPFVWLGKALKEAVRLSGGRQMLIIIDEFNQLLELERNKLLDQRIYHNLRSVMAEQNDVRWLLITQESDYLRPLSWGGARDIIQQGLSIPITQLDFVFAKKLICQPAERSGVHYLQDIIPEEIYTLTAGNPYLIKIICYHLINQVHQHGRSDINFDDLRDSIYLILGEGERYFDHYLRRLNGYQKQILAGIAHCYPGQDWVALSDVTSRIRSRLEPRMGEDTFRESIESLELYGLLETGFEGGEKKARIPIGLFGQWVRQNYKI